MAYAAVVSLKQTIHRLLTSSQISIVFPGLEIIKSAYYQVEPLQKLLETLDSSSGKTMNDLDGRIREAVHKLEDVIESHVSNQFLSQSESLGDVGCSLIPSVDLEEVRQEFDSFAETVMKLKKDLELRNQFSDDDDDASVSSRELRNQFSDDDDDASVSSRNGLRGKKSKIVGLSDEVSNIVNILHRGFKPSVLGVVSLVGMAGIGKTTVAEEVFDDPSIFSHFDYRVWITLGPKYQSEEILLDILSQIHPDIDKLSKKRDEVLALRFSNLFTLNKCLIVLDDVWSTEVLDYLQRPSLVFKNGSRVLLTTRLDQVAEFPKTYVLHRMRLLDEEKSWCLLREKVFAKELCPPELEKAGKKIAGICQGLPLTIVTVAGLLSKVEKTADYWKKVAVKEHPIFKDAYDKMSKVLFPSYKYLPQYLKACFLYMGIFPQNFEIPYSKLINLWSAEGFLEPNPSQTVENFAAKCLRDLVSKSLVMVCQQSSSIGIKTCGLHSVFWHLSIKEAEKSKFFHVINSNDDGLAEGIKTQPRLCIHKNILFGIKDVYNSMASVSTVRSLLCTGPHHQYPVPICFGLRLLRVLDAITIRYYKFPYEALKLDLLRYLAVTFNGKLPPSISKLWNLQCLIVRRHLSIKSSGDQSYMPSEIWDMKELKHLQVMGSNLPDRSNASLPNLLTLLDVSADSCTEGVFKCIPNLKKLGIRIELGPDAAEHFCCFDHISLLNRLESLKCVVVDPEVKSKVIAPPALTSNFPSGLKKLTLSGFGYPWEDMSKIASLPNLEVLKLRCYAFRGPKWEIKDKGFLRLEFLLIEDTDLVHWTVVEGSFRMLQSLSIKHCYKLEKIPPKFLLYQLDMIELVDCTPSAVTSAKQMLKGRRKVDFRVHSSWDDGKLKS